VPTRSPEAGSASGEEPEQCSARSVPIGVYQGSKIGEQENIQFEQLTIIIYAKARIPGTVKRARKAFRIRGRANERINSLTFACVLPLCSWLERTPNVRNILTSFAFVKG
jgi:hypothetical protein